MNTLIKNLQKLSKSMEQKRKVGKVNIFGAILFFVAAFFAVSLALAFIGEGEGNFLSGPGSFLANAYGYSSILIPVFFLTAALQMIGAKWNIKKGVILVGSILPFFTLVAVEHICKIFAAKNSGAVATIEITSTIVFGIILIVGEYILLVILGEIFHERYSKGGFDFDNFDESDFDKPLGTGKDDEAASNNGDKFEAKPSADSPILDEMLEKATEIPRTQGETVLEFIKKQKPVDLEAIFKNAERKARAERDEREAREAEERSRMEEEAVPAESAEVEAEAASGTEQEPPAADQPAETQKSKETADVINNIMARIQAAGTGETTEDSYGEPEAETELEDEEGGKNDEIDLNDDFWSSSADLEPFDKEAAIEMQKRENENKFSKIFDAVENDSEVKLTDWRYEEALKNILPEMLHEQQQASPLPRQAPSPADFKSQIETLLAKKHEESSLSPASDETANYANENAEIASDETADYANENAIASDESTDYTNENAEIASANADYANESAIANDESANYTTENAEIASDETASYANENAEIANDESANYANENAEIASDESANYTNENSEIANANADYANESAETASDETASYANENAEIANDETADYASENAETTSDESANYANENAEIAGDESANFANENAETASENAETASDESANYANENAEIANANADYANESAIASDESANYATESAEIASDESSDYATENAEIASDETADYANENAEIAGDGSANFATESAEIASDESADYANENAEIASDANADYANESAETANANANFATENAEIASDESADYATESTESASDESANFANESAIASDESADYANENAEIASDETANFANESAKIANANFANESAIASDESAAQIPVSTSDLKIEDIISSMDDDAAENPVLKEPIQEVVAKIMEKKKAEQSVEQPRPEPVLSEFESRAEKIERKPREIEEMTAAEEALKAASNETYEPMQNAESREFDPTARPVVDANGNLIHYPEEEEDEVQEDDEQLKNEILGYQAALKAEDEDEEDEESDDDYDDDFEEEIDDLNRTMNRTMNASEALDEENEEDDIEDDDEGTAAPAHSIDPYAASANSMPESQKFRKGPYIVPTDLLDSYPGNEYWIVDDETRQSGNDLVETLKEFKIDTEITGIRKGPTVTMYELLPAPGVKLSKIVNLQDNIALRLAASSVRIVAPIPGKHAVGIEVPNRNRAIVSFRELIEQPLPAFDKMAIPVVLGKDISGEPQLLDLAKTPHLLIAGSTGAGKSVCVNSMLLSILYKRSPEQVKLVLVDPKVVELKLYNDIPHLLTPVITDAKRALQSLQYCLCEMERRYALLDGMGVRNIISYNKKIVEKHIATEKLPYIVVVIDEFADLMATTGKELETTIARLAAMSRAVGIHLVLATQRPSVDVITGLIKANIPSRIAFMVASKTDSRIIIDQLGADKLLGKGDMLYVGVTDPFPSRIQGTLVGDDEVERVVEYVKGFGEPEYIDEEMFVDEDEEEEDTTVFDEGEDPLYDQALQIVLQAGKASASYIQRRLKIGYNRAARLVEEMEERGIVGPQNGSKPREVIHLP